MRNRTFRRVTVALALTMGIAGLSIAWSVRRQRDFLKDQQLRVLGWGGGVSKRIRPDPLFDPLKEWFGHALIDPIAGFDGYHVEATGHRQPSKEQLAQLLDFRPVRSVEAIGAIKLGDDWVEGIRDPSLVESLLLGSSGVTDRSVPEFSKMRKLEHLNLDDTRISDDAIDQLCRLPRLRRLEVGGANIRTIRLLDLRLTDGLGRFAETAGQATRIRGRIAIAERRGVPSTVEIMAFQRPGEWGFNGQASAIVEESPGIFAFVTDVSAVPPGRFDVHVTVHSRPAGGLMILSCHLISSLRPGELESALAKEGVAADR
jgi:hypothetical protein